ncbi:MAG: hypothetical protein HeimC2_14950 [Candidatus Heimdallarchaeota archaeon LC_2]|nr:MAG: hypothetical protein HeimC2_14950 [Candidatus Heimdallarchaeota archaeon LC_2]
MAKEIRSVLRKIDEAILKGDTDRAYELTKSAVSDYDLEKSYSDSIEILLKLSSYEAIEQSRISHQEIMAHLLIRYVINGEVKKAKRIKFLDDFKLPICELAKSVLETHTSDKIAPYVLQSIEKKSIFGEYIKMSEFPALLLESEDDIVRILEDYYSDGKYIATMLERKSLLQHSKKVDIGISEETNVVENRRVYRLG